MKNLFTNWLFLGFLGMASMTHAQIACNSFIQVALSSDGEVDVYPEFVLEGNQTGDFEISKDGSNFSSFVTYDCSEIGSSTIAVRNAQTGNTCWGTIEIEDKLKPIPYAISAVTVVSDTPNCSIELWAKDFDAQSFDNCDIATYSFGQNGYFPSPTLINDTLIDLSVPHYFNDNGVIVDDSTPSQATLDQYTLGNLMRWDPAQESAGRIFYAFGLQNISFSVSDASGLSDYADITLNVLACNNSGSPACINDLTVSTDLWNPITTIPASTFVSGGAQNAVVSLDQLVYNSNLELTCNDVADNIDLYIKYEFEGDTIDCQVTFNFRDLVVPVAIAETQITLQLADANDEVSISVDDVDDGSYDICGIANRSLSKTTFDVSDLGINQVVLTIEDLSGNVNTVFTDVIVILDGVCSFTENDIVWPDAILQMNVPNIEASSLTPMELMNTYGFASHQVEPSLSVNCVVGIAYADVVIDLPIGLDTYFKIVRTWTLLNWTTGEVFTFNQLINNLPNSSLFICDFLPRIAPVGDCNSGHTLDDDVEWPNDILVDDHRISPIELVAISGIDPLDAAPSFYNEPSQYTRSYEDVLIDLSPDEIELGRRWTVTRLDNGFTYNYTQLIAVDISNFGNLVTVSDPVGRAIEGAEINGNIMTDNRGRAIITDNVQSVEKIDASLRGLTLLDVELMREHILGISMLDSVGILAGDMNENGILTTLDLVFLMKYLIGDTSIDTYADFKFIDATEVGNDALSPRGAYISYRLGDVDHSYASQNSSGNLTNAVAFEDQILNAGESYSVPLYLNADIIPEALQLNDVAYDEQLISIEGATNALSTDEVYVNTVNGAISFITTFGNSNSGIEKGDPLFYFNFTATANGLLSDVLNLEGSTVSILANGKQLYESDVEVSDVILTPTFEVDEVAYSLNVFPNPATSWVQFDVENNSEITSIQLFNSFGQLVLKEENKSRIDVDELTNGLYIYVVEIEGQFVKGRLNIIKP
jgi:hypothetical protein